MEEFSHVVSAIAGAIGLPTAIGLIFSVLVQPQRTRVNWAFTLFAICTAGWASVTLMREISALDFVDNDKISFHFLSMVLFSAIASYFVFVVVFCELKGNTIINLLIGLVILYSFSIVVVVTDRWVDYPSDGDWQPLPLGYVVLLGYVGYLGAAYILLKLTGNERTKSLELPTLLFLTATFSNVIPYVNLLAADNFLGIFIVILLGREVLRFQLFNPLQEANNLLAYTNKSLRTVNAALTEEKGKVEKLNLELAEASRYKSEFLANMSHELRTPLNSIVGYSELLRQEIYGPLNERQQDRLEKIHRNGQTLLALINDILDLSKIEAGRLELNPISLDLKALIESVVQTVEPITQKKGLQVHVEIADGLPTVFVDELRMRQVLLNLVNNAVKFTHQGYIAIRIHALQVKDGVSDRLNLPLRGWLMDGRWLCVAVEDTGIGIDPADQAHIFEAFRQADGSVTREYGGTGLGLAITQRLVQLHNGQIWVKSTPQLGSTFYLALPISADNISLPIRESEIGEKNAHQRTVLVVDDNEQDVDILTVHLSGAGYQVSHVYDGRMALERAQALKPDVIIVDLMLIGITGWEVIAELRKDPQVGHIPIVIVSVVDREPIGFEIGASAHLVKPVNQQELVKALGEVMRHAIHHDQPILVVDDSDDDREIMSTLIRNMGHEVVTVTGGAESLTWLEEHEARLVVLDLMMPNVSGFQVLRFIRGSKRLQKVPVLIVTAKELTNEDHKFLSENLAPVIGKQDIWTTNLVEQINEILQQKSAVL